MKLSDMINFTRNSCKNLTFLWSSDQSEQRDKRCASRPKWPVGPATMTSDGKQPEVISDQIFKEKSSKLDCNEKIKINVRCFERKTPQGYLIGTFSRLQTK